nr:apoptosis facilitator Bcl-2-like protein 14 isoform X1 [Misgurnus anguillicaudatus]
MDTDQSNNHVPVPEDSLEFRLLMAYTRKRRPTDSRLQKDETKQKTATTEDSDIRSKKKKKSFSKRVSSLFMCVKPKTKEDFDSVPKKQPAMLRGVSDVSVVSDGEKVEGMASELTEISNSVHFEPSDIESDGGDDPLIQKIVELLKVHGDELNEKIMADKALSESLASSLSYSFFSTVMDSFCTSVSRELPPQEEVEKTEVALICEATSKLFGVDHHPMRRVLGFGAKYLQEKFPNWISINIGNEVEDEEEAEVE